jgi:hypothetical protein
MSRSVATSPHLAGTWAWITAYMRQDFCQGVQALSKHVARCMHVLITGSSEATATPALEVFSSRQCLDHMQRPGTFRTCVYISCDSFNPPTVSGRTTPDCIQQHIALLRKSRTCGYMQLHVAVYRCVQVHTAAYNFA